MAALFHSAAVRAVLIAGVLAVVAAFTAPTARGQEVLSAESRVLRTDAASAQHSGLSTQHFLLLADEFSWNEFVRFWNRQLGSMTGVIGTVVLVAGAAFLIIMSKGK